MLSKVKYFAVALLVVDLVAISGCKNPDAAYSKVTGTVTFEGSPVQGASLVFYSQSQSGESGAAMTDATGAYAATSSGATQGGVGLLPGEYKVTVAKYSEVSDPDQEAFEKGEITYDELQERKAKQGAYAKSEKAELLTPAKFSTTNGTPLTITVSAGGDNVFDFNLDE